MPMPSAVDAPYTTHDLARLLDTVQDEPRFEEHPLKEKQAEEDEMDCAAQRHRRERARRLERLHNVLGLLPIEAAASVARELAADGRGGNDEPGSMAGPEGESDAETGK